MLNKIDTQQVQLDTSEPIGHQQSSSSVIKMPTFQAGGSVQTQKMLKQGGMLQEGGTVDPVSGNKVPVGAMKEEVRDDVPAQLSEGEFVFPADVVRYIGLERLMQMRQAAKKGLMQMEEMGQMSNGEEGSEEEDTAEFESELDDIMSEMEGEGEEREMAVGGDVMPMEQAPAEQPAAPAMQQTPEAIPTGTETPTLTEEQMAKIQETAKNMQSQQSQFGDLPPNNPTEGLKSYDIVKSNFTPERQQDADAFLSKVSRLAKAKRVIMTRYNDTVVLGFVKSAGVVDPLVFSNDPPEKLNDAVIAGIQVAKKSGIRRFESDKSNPLMVSTLSKMGYPVEDLGDKGWALTLE